MRNAEVVAEVEKGYRIPQPDECPDDLYEVMMKCWEDIPSKRPSFGEITTMLQTVAKRAKFQKKKSSSLILPMQQSESRSYSSGLELSNSQPTLSKADSKYQTQAKEENK